MAIELINRSASPNSKKGDTAWVFTKKINDNFSDQDNAASRFVGTLPEQIPTNAMLGTIPRTVNFTSASGSVSLNDFNLQIGDRVLVRKLNTTQGTVTITCTGHTFTRASLTSVTLNSDGDFWLMEKVSSTRLDLVDGQSTGTNSNGEWLRLASGYQKCTGYRPNVPSAGANVTASIAITPPAQFVSNSHVTAIPYTDTPSSYGVITSSLNSGSSFTLYVIRNIASNYYINWEATGRWYA